MAQTVYLTTPPLGLPAFPAALGVPTSPDPTPLRMLAFSVAEAALENDPNSPSFLHVLREDPAHMASIDAALSQALAAEAASVNVNEKQKARWSGSDWHLMAAKTNLWDVVEKAKERRQASPAPARAKTPPLSPASYKFVMPAHSPLAASIERVSRPGRLATGRAVLETRSAEPSPTSFTFAGLDQTRPPPEFVPRLSAEEFSAQSKQISSVKHVRTKSDESLRAVMAESGSGTTSSGGGSGRGSTRGPRVKAPLPSLKQIQAKLSQERTTGSPDAKVAVVQRPNGGVQRTNSDDSVEVLQTPTDERPSLAILSRRPATPPSPPAQQQTNEMTKSPSPAPAAARLAPFLRERTSGRLAQGAAGSSGAKSSFCSTPPPKRPVLTVTPPSCERRQPLARLDLVSPSRAMSVPPPITPLLNRRVVTSPTGSRFPALSDLARYSPRTPSSPTGSAGGSLSPGSMPIITCTPAPAKIVKDGVEHDSDEECDEVVVFDGEQEEARERQERERRATQMKERLRLRRSSD